MTITATDFDYIRSVVLAGASIVLEPGKEYLVETRLVPVAREEGVRTVSDLIGRLRTASSTGLRARVIDAMTTNETSFFRDGHPFAALSQTVIPELLAARRTERALNIWSAAASSGQEPYSLAMLLDEALVGDPTWRIRMLASDISEKMIERARAGTYSDHEVSRGLCPDRISRHLRAAGDQWQVRERLRQMVEFRTINLDAPWPTLPKMDLILLRNVLIYFDVPTKRRILEGVRTVLRPDGYLFLGGAETTINVDDSFERIQVGTASAYRLRLHGGRR